MARYGAAVSRAGINTANTAYFNLFGGTSERLLIREIVINVSVAPTTAPIFYLVRTTARGTQASTLGGQPYDSADVAATATLDVCGTGGSQPTFTNTNLIRAGGLAVTAGGAFVFSFWDLPLIVPATAAAGLAIANVNASGATTGTFVGSYVWDE